MSMAMNAHSLVSSCTSASRLEYCELCYRSISSNLDSSQNILWTDSCWFSSKYWRS
uniref:Uncharacterized protein n=1 Tax=Arundo donax TaxID=35708 RepID=A0A0A8Z3Q6_ARUDO